MRIADKRSPLASIPGFTQNAVLQLIVASATGFIAYHLIRIILLIAGAEASYFNTNFTPNLALQNVHGFSSRIWVLFTYGWTHNGFWELFSNMVWLYAFGSIIQALVSYRQIIPLFIYSLIIGGLAYEAAQFIPGAENNMYVLGAQAGVFGVAVAALTLSPSYRFYLAAHFSIPIVVLFVIFTVLMLINTNMQTAQLILLAGGGLTGFGYIMLMKNGYRPGLWIYDIFDSLDRMADPDKRTKHRVANTRSKAAGKINELYDAQKRIDDILDKINQKGYNSLSQEEKDILLKASKDKDI